MRAFRIVNTAMAPLMLLLFVASGVAFPKTTFCEPSLNRTVPSKSLIGSPVRNTARSGISFTCRFFPLYMTLSISDAESS